MMKTAAFRLSYLLVALSTFGFSACAQTGGEEQKDTTMTMEAAGEVADLPLVQFHDRMMEQPGQLVDVRTPEEYAGGHAQGASNINFLDKNFLRDFEAAIDKDKPVYIYCASGNRSGKAKSTLEKAGYKYIYNLTGAGYAQWAAAGYPTEQ